MSKYYITTAIDYTNDVIHLGHIFQKLVADVLARYHRLKLGEENVFFLTGTDEYGQKAQRAAYEAGIPTKEFVDQITTGDQRQQESLNISYNRFIRTTDADHKEVVWEIWQRALKNNDIYLGKYTGLYCEGCEAFYTQKDLVEGKCPFHPNLDIQKVEEENYFFRWSKYKDFLINHIKIHPEFIVPSFRGKEMLEFAEDLKDIPISRANLSWGIPVPDNPEQKIYVWFDALTNYLTGIGFLADPKQFEKFWPADLHILGKDNVRWHALLWPAMLKSAGLALPQTVLVNGFITLNGQKISKSLGNIIRPTDWVNKYTADGVRHYLLRYTTITEDSDVSEEKLLQSYNSDLANGLGNLVARVAKLCDNNQISVSLSNLKLSSEVGSLIESYKLNEAFAFIWSTISQADKKINEEEPWRLEKEKAQPILEDLVGQIQQIAFNLKPFLPDTSDKILAQFLGEIKSSAPLFPRLK